MKETIGSDRAICALSGGVDSSVAAALVQKAIGDQLTCVFVDHGLLREGGYLSSRQGSRSTVELPSAAVPNGLTFTATRESRAMRGSDAATGEAWTAAGRLGDLVWNGNRLGEVTLDGNGTVPTADGKVQQVLGDLSLAAAGVALQDAGLRDAIGSEVTLRTGFNLTPGNALRLTGLSLDGQDYGLSGTLDVNGLSTGITVTGDVTLDAEGYAPISPETDDVSRETAEAA